MCKKEQLSPGGTHGTTIRDPPPQYTAEGTTSEPSLGTRESSHWLVCNLKQVGHLSVPPSPSRHKDKNNTKSQEFVEPKKHHLFAWQSHGTY